MRIEILLILSSLVIFQNCGKIEETLTVDDMIVAVNTSEQDGLLADGRAIHIEAIINPEAQASTRKVLFTSNGGSFKDADDDELIVEATMENGLLSADAIFIAPLSEGEVTISVQMDLADLRGKYVTEKPLRFAKSDPAAISIEADAFSVFNGFDGEINLSGKLSNAMGNGVQLGTRVELIDLYEEDDGRVNGKFRDMTLSSGPNSEISAVYSPGAVTPDQTIKIIANVLDENSNPIPGVTDTIFIEVIEKN